MCLKSPGAECVGLFLVYSFVLSTSSNQEKSEIRNTKSETIFKIINSNAPNRFEFISFDIRICFVLRYSNFEFIAIPKKESIQKKSLFC